MKFINSPFVVAVASVSGGGKTTAVANLAKHLSNAKALYFDQYDFEGPDDPVQWLYKGANYNDWNLKPLHIDLDKLLAEPLDYIILDFPFADQHTASNKYIDFTVFIDTPLDLALSRRLIRDFTDGSKEEILADIQYYATRGRAAYLHMLSAIKSNSDLVIDGTGSIEDICDEIMLKLENL